MEEEPSFTWGNFDVCMYCTKAGFLFGKVETRNYCTLHKNEQGRPTYIVVGAETGRKNVIDGYYGCSEFTPCGLPAHTLVKEDMLRRNQKVESITSDPNALETGFDFPHKRLKYPYKEILRDGRILERSPMIY